MSILGSIGKILRGADEAEKVAAGAEKIVAKGEAVEKVVAGAKKYAHLPPPPAMPGPLGWKGALPRDLHEIKPSILDGRPHIPVKRGIPVSPLPERTKNAMRRAIVAEGAAGPAKWRGPLPEGIKGMRQRDRVNASRLNRLNQMSMKKKMLVAGVGLGVAGAVASRKSPGSQRGAPPSSYSTGMYGY